MQSCPERQLVESLGEVKRNAKPSLAQRFHREFTTNLMLFIEDSFQRDTYIKRTSNRLQKLFAEISKSRYSNQNESSVLDEWSKWFINLLFRQQIFSGKSMCCIHLYNKTYYCPKRHPEKYKETFTLDTNKRSRIYTVLYIDIFTPSSQTLLYRYPSIFAACSDVVHKLLAIFGKDSSHLIRLATFNCYKLFLRFFL